MEKFFETNKKYWNESVDIHKKSDLYKLDEFKKGINKLHSIELNDLGDIKGKKILHLQCHFGMDSLSLAMLGADVTGIDFSETAIENAVQLSSELNINAKFYCSDVYSLLTNNLLADESFDIVFTSYGVIYWLPDLDKWADVIYKFLKPGGFFYIAESHPISGCFDFDNKIQNLKFTTQYFKKDEPFYFENGVDYAIPEHKMDNNSTYEWNHSLSEILNVFLKRKFIIEDYKEYPFTVWKQYPNMKLLEDGYFHFTDSKIDLPLLFSLKAKK
ncbi:MAG TPA: class I SAM-dependent methyltransferase [Ignavibacteria bacterium]|nr:class I SAM-dependent methyltransferase [Ignavibacteria bacterium]